jgi:CTP synthase
VGVVAKYMDNIDTYFSVFEALRSAALWNDTNIEIKWIDAEALESKEDVSEDFAGVDGIVVPGGFGTRGLEGKIRAAQYSLKNKFPYLGLCLGLQMAVIGAARNGGLTDATTAELDSEAKNKVIHTMADQHGKENTGGTMRLGDYPCKVAEDSLAAKLYGSTDIVERHRHRYECNNDFRDQYESWGIRPVGLSPDDHLVEMIEGIDHPFFMASQFHPELKSRPNRPHPMFNGFIASLLQKPTE